jgi:hypothetical protein
VTARRKEKLNENTKPQGGGRERKDGKIKRQK